MIIRDKQGRNTVMQSTSSQVPLTLRYLHLDQNAARTKALEDKPSSINIDFKACVEQIVSVVLEGRLQMKGPSHPDGNGWAFNFQPIQPSGQRSCIGDDVNYLMHGNICRSAINCIGKSEVSCYFTNTCFFTHTSKYQRIKLSMFHFYFFNVLYEVVMREKDSDNAGMCATPMSVLQFRKAIPVLPLYRARRATIFSVCTIIDFERNGKRMCTIGSSALLSGYLRVQQGTSLVHDIHCLCTS